VKGIAITRWITFQAPDAVIEVDDDGAHPIGPGDIAVANWVIRLPADAAAIGGTFAGRGYYTAAWRRSGHRTTSSGRGWHASRSPSLLLLANRYPETPSISYIPSVAWTNTLKLGGDHRR
jgi:hypothetical protein